MHSVNAFIVRNDQFTTLRQLPQALELSCINRKCGMRAGMVHIQLPPVEKSRTI